MKHFLNFNTLFSNMFGVGVISAFIMFVKLVIKSIKRTRERDESLKIAVKSLLHNELITLCNHHLEKGFVTVSDYNNLHHLYSSYVALGGNGSIVDLVERVKTLPNKEVTK